jgi:hypothetical protein
MGLPLHLAREASFRAAVDAFCGKVFEGRGGLDLTLVDSIKFSSRILVLSKAASRLDARRGAFL